MDCTSATFASPDRHDLVSRREASCRQHGPKRLHAPKSALAAELFHATRIVAVTLAALALVPVGATAQTNFKLKPESGEAQWIWSHEHTPGKVPTGACYFRKKFELDSSESGRIQIACDDRYDLYINGRHVGGGERWQVLNSFDIQPFLKQGTNVIAVRAENTSTADAGLVARVVVRRRGGTDVSYSTDPTWKATAKEISGWETVSFNDNAWSGARSLGELGVAAPWGNRLSTDDGSQASRFTLPPEFAVQRVVPPEAAGSLVAMTFNEWGEMLASREGGGLILIIDRDSDGAVDGVINYCDQVKNCQGILALNGDVYCVGDGPEGAGFYRLIDEDRDQKAETVKRLIEFDPGIGEHGPHAAVLGPDGMIYVLVGNHSAAKVEYAETSPHRDYYDGDMFLPRYEDPGGHAVGIKAPGGVVLRTDPEGKTVELVAGGFRNPYDLAFNADGELFTFDSDMEWDMGLPWYRPTRIVHVVPGGEYGWRSGWQKFPTYFIDNLPPTSEQGRGSPTGVEFYNHYKFPIRYQRTLFACDWSQGRIMNLRLERVGGSYRAKSEVFLEGRPLNVTDLEVGPDGWLYFATGGRGTEGGIYRVVWRGTVPPQNLPTPVARAVRQPQLASAWSRQTLAVLQQEMGERWAPDMLGVAVNPANHPTDRVRALDLLQLFGPSPEQAFLARLAKDGSAEVRAKAAFLMGVQAETSATPTLAALAADSDALVRRIACEAIVRSGHAAKADALVPLLADRDRFVAWAARRALERVPLDEWKTAILRATNQRVFLVGATALATVAHDRETSLAILERSRAMLAGYISDADYIDLMRVMQLALLRGEITAAEAVQLRRDLSQEYPTANARMNRELVRLLVYLQASDVLPRFILELRNGTNPHDQLHLAFHLRFLNDGWTSTQKLTLLQFFEEARKRDGGHSFAGYLENVSRDFFATFNDEERKVVLARGTLWPTASLAVLASLPKDAGRDVLDRLIALDGQLAELASKEAEPDEPTKMLRTGIVAVLANSGDDESFAYLRKLFEQEPERRGEIAMGLAQSAEGDNWNCLVRALPVLDGVYAQEVLSKLAASDEKPDDAEPVRQVILCGLRLGADGNALCLKVLEHWTGEQPESDGTAWDKKLAAWQTWFHEKYPDAPLAELPQEPAGAKWSFAELNDFLHGAALSEADRVRGAAVFERAQCSKCHRFGTKGDGLGPDLSTVSQRFQKREVLEAIVYPSHVISDQYATKTVVTVDGLSYTGLVGAGPGGSVVVLQSNGQKATIAKADVSEMAPSAKSTMPEGLLNTLTLEEIADLFSYLNTPPSTPMVTERPAR